MKIKYLNIIEMISSIGLLIVTTMIFSIKKTISYEVVSTFEATPESSIFVVMDNNPLLGNLILCFGITLAISAVLRRLKCL